MERELFNTRMTAAVRATELSWGQARDLFTKLEADCADGMDPELFGWVHFYLFKAAYMTEDWAAAFKLLEAPRLISAISQTNAIWIASVGAEVASHIGNVSTVLTQGKRCLEIREGDLAGQAMAAQTICALLAKMGAHAHAGEFADSLISLGKTLADVDKVALGYRALACSLEGNPNPLRIDALIAATDWLEEHASNRWAKDALVILKTSVAVEKRRHHQPLAQVLWDAALRGERRVALAPGRVESAMDSEHTYRDFALAYSRGMLPELRDLDDDALLAAALEEGLRLHRFKRTGELPRVRKAIGILQGFRPQALLDIGTGRGTFLWPALDQLPEMHVTCVDSSQHRVKDLEAVRVGGLKRIVALRGDAAELPFADASFDAATALEVLEHVADPAPVAAELLRTTTTVVIATVPAKEDNNPEHIRLFTRESLSALFTDAGARSVRIEHVLNHIVAIVRPAEREEQ